MISRHDKDTYFPMSFNEQMSWLGEEIERIIKRNEKNIVRDRNAHGFGYAHTINRMFNIIKEDPKNIAVLREVKQAEREWWAYVDNEPDALTEDEIFTYWNNYMLAYCAELKAQPVSYFLMRVYDECHDRDEWIGIYDSLPKLKHAYENVVQGLEKEHEKYEGNNRTVTHEKVMINTFNKASGKWCYDVPYEILFPKKDEPESEEYKTVQYIIDHPEMYMFKQQYIFQGRYGNYICDSQTFKTIRPADEIIQVRFRAKNTYEIFEILGNWRGGWNDCPDWRTMRDKAQEWYIEYGAELKEMAHDTLVFVCRKLSEEEADILWDDICRFAPNSRDIADEDAIKERLWLNSEFTLWWD